MVKNKSKVAVLRKEVAEKVDTGKRKAAIYKARLDYVVKLL